MAGKPGQRGDKPTQTPEKFSERFLEDLDGRCRVARELKQRLSELMADLGGEESLSYQQRSLCKRVIHLEGLIESREAALARGEPVEIGQLVQATNALIGLFKTLGLKRKAKEISLEQHLRKNYEAPER